MTTPISFFNHFLKQVLPHAAKDPRIAGLLLVAKGQSVCAQALLSHPTLRMQRGELAGFRVGQDKLADMDLIKSGRLEIGNSSQGEIPRIKVGDHYKFENTLSAQERIEVLSAPSILPNVPKEGPMAHPVSTRVASRMDRGLMRIEGGAARRRSVTLRLAPTDTGNCSSQVSSNDPNDAERLPIGKGRRPPSAAEGCFRQSGWHASSCRG